MSNTAEMLEVAGALRQLLHMTPTIHLRTAMRTPALTLNGDQTHMYAGISRAIEIIEGFANAPTILASREAEAVA